MEKRTSKREGEEPRSASTSAITIDGGDPKNGMTDIGVGLRMSLATIDTHGLARPATIVIVHSHSLSPSCSILVQNLEHLALGELDSPHLLLEVIDVVIEERIRVEAMEFPPSV